MVVRPSTKNNDIASDAHVLVEQSYHEPAVTVDFLHEEISHLSVHPIPRIMGQLTWTLTQDYWAS
jgi:hypothetical protein